MDETQAYFTQHILYDYIRRHPELEEKHPGIRRAARDEFAREAAGNLKGWSMVFRGTKGTLYLSDGTAGYVIEPETNREEPLPALSLRIDLNEGGRIGPGKIRLLEQIRESGSISAWTLIQPWPRAVHSCITSSAGPRWSRSSSSIIVGLSAIGRLPGLGAAGTPRW